MNNPSEEQLREWREEFEKLSFMKVSGVEMPLDIRKHYKGYYESPTTDFIWMGYLRAKKKSLSEIEQSDEEIKRLRLENEMHAKDAHDRYAEIDKLKKLIDSHEQQLAALEELRINQQAEIEQRGEEIKKLKNALNSAVIFVVNDCGSCDKECLEYHNDDEPCRHDDFLKQTRELIGVSL